MRLRQTLIPSLLLLSASGAAAQQVGGGWKTKYEVDGAAFYYMIGWSVDVVGDVNNDGVADMITGANYGAPGGKHEAGHAYLISGVDGSTLFTFDGENEYDLLGSASAWVGDVDGDNVPDSIVGAPSGMMTSNTDRPGLAYVYSGADGSVIWKLNGAAHLDTFGGSVSGVGDVNFDGHDDILVGARGVDHNGMQNAGSAYIYSGKDGSMLHEFQGGSQYAEFGFSAAGIGDINGDGAGDVIVGAPRYNAGFGEAGGVFVYSGADGSLIRQYVAPAGVIMSFGFRVRGAGDVDGDMVPDYLVGAPMSGRAWLYSGASGALIHGFSAPPMGMAFGADVVGMGDLDMDGTPDIGISGPMGGPDQQGVVYLYSGKTGEMLHEQLGGAHGDSFGMAICGPGDLDGDGKLEIAVGAPAADPLPYPDLDAGILYTFGFDPFIKANEQSVSAANGGMVVYELGFPMEAAMGYYQMLYSLSGMGPTMVQGVEVPLSPDWAFQGSLQGRYPAFAWGFNGVLDSSGMGTAAFVIPAGALKAGLIGRSLHLAAVAGSAPNALMWSSAAEMLTIQP